MRTGREGAWKVNSWSEAAAEGGENCLHHPDTGAGILKSLSHPGMAPQAGKHQSPGQKGLQRDRAGTAAAIRAGEAGTRLEDSVCLLGALSHCKGEETQRGQPEQDMLRGAGASNLLL